jgi:hypothetical protein
MTTIQDTLAERGKTYGEFIDNALCSQALKHVMENSLKWSSAAADQREALTVIAQKISRLLTGDIDHIDSWHDISGYATLVENRLKKR